MSTIKKTDYLSEDQEKKLVELGFEKSDEINVILYFYAIDFLLNKINRISNWEYQFEMYNSKLTRFSQGDNHSVAYGRDNCLNELINLIEKHT